jgi:hypothetical protein
MIRSSRRTAALTAVALGALLAMAAIAPPVYAETGDADVTWSVQPADEKGPDGRSWVELTLDPGEHVVDHLALRNLSKSAVTFSIKAADGYITPKGRFNMLPSDKKSVDAGTWVTGPTTVQVGAGKTEIVAFTVAVPENATPGDHAAGIAATVQSVGPSGNGNQVAIESRVGFPVMTRVTGDLRPSLHITPVSVAYDMSWNPFQPGTVTAVYEVVNDGNVRIQASPVVEAQGTKAQADSKTPAIELLPGEHRQISTPVSGIWPLFFLPVEVLIDPTVVTPNGDPQKADAVSRQFGVWAVPLPQLLVLAGIVLVLLALWAGRRRSRRRVQAMLAEAREAGRREATT